MPGPLNPSHAAALVSLAASTARDCVLVSSCGARLEVPGLLLALHSPLLAPLLGQGKKGISLPLSLSVVRSLVSLLQGGELEELELEEGLQEGIKEAETLLGITEVPQDRLNKVKHEAHTKAEVREPLEVRHDINKRWCA